MNVRCGRCGQVFESDGPPHACAAQAAQSQPSVFLPPLTPTYAQSPQPRSNGALWFGGGAVVAVVVVVILLLARGGGSDGDATDVVVTSSLPATVVTAAPAPATTLASTVGSATTVSTVAVETSAAPTQPPTTLPVQTAPVQTVTVAPGAAATRLPSQTWDGNYEPEPASGPLSIGQQGERVRQLQMDLRSNGVLDGGTADGFFGPGTENAVVDFQRARGLPVDGIAGEATLNALADPGD
jgi:hypothetical protein